MQTLNHTIFLAHVLNSKVAKDKIVYWKVTWVTVLQILIRASQKGSGFKHIGYVFKDMASPFN